MYTRFGQMRRIAFAAAVFAAAWMCGSAFAALLPSEYQEVAYIESTGLQCVDTGYKPNASKTGVVMKFNSGAYANNVTFFGLNFSGSCYLFIWQNNNFCFYGAPSTITGKAGNENRDLSLTIVPNGSGAGTLTLRDMNNESELVKEVPNVSLAVGNASMKLFGIGANYRHAYRLYRFTITECDETTGENVVVHDFVPCYRKDGGEIGLYDILSEDADTAFKTDGIGSAPFLKGKNIYYEDLLEVSGNPVEVGTVSPAYGENPGNQPGDSFTCTASAVWTNSAETIAAKCTGYKVYTNDVVYVEGADNSFTYTHPDTPRGAKLVWQWEVEYKITAGEGATVSPAWVKHGNAVTVTATPPAGKAFYRWTDTVTGTIYTDNPLRVRATGLMNLVPEFGNAVFVATDGDDTTGDGSSAAPYATLAKALSVAAATDNVILKAGTHTVTAEATISSAITVRGETGRPEDVVLAASGAIRLFTLKHAEATVADLTLANGKPGGNGGAVYLDTAGGVVRNCVVTNCVANSWGGNGGAFYLAGADALVENCVVSNCYNNENGNGPAQMYGCGLAACAKAGTIRNCLLFHNGNTKAAANRGGTVLLDGGGLLENCTVADNFYLYCSGIWATGNAKVKNCVILGNTVREDLTGHETVWTGSAACFENCIAPLYINDDCIVDNRIVRDFAAGDLTPVGAAVDTGLAADWQNAALDVAGRARVSGAAVDLGCYECDRTADPLNVTADRTQGIAPLTVTFMPNAFGVAGATIEWDWDGDGSFDAESSGATTHEFAQGRHFVNARVKGTDNTLAVPVEIHSIPKAIYVDPDCATPQFPYGDMEHAATDLFEAYDIAVDGCEIVLAAKTHILAATLNAGKAVTVRGVTGNPADVTLKAQSTANRVVVLSNPSSCLASLSMTNGKYAGEGGGVCITAGGGVISNCVVHGCQNNKWGTCGGAMVMDSADALVTHCVFSNNLCAASGNGPSQKYGGGMAIYLKNGKVRNSLFIRNGNDANSPNRGGAIYMDGGEVDNCTITRNRHTNGSGIYAGGGTVRNTIIFGNVCSASYEGHGEVYNGDTAVFVNCRTPIEINGSCPATPAPFVNFGTEDYGPGLACVDSATLLDWMTDGMTDLAGLARVQGNGPDVGCYERDMSQFSVAVEADATGGVAPLDVTFTVVAFGAGASGLSCQWDWNGDGVWDDTSDGTTNHVFASGSHSVRVKVTDIDSSKSYEPEEPFAIVVVPKTLYVDGNSTAALSPYGAPEHAAATVADALDAALPGCEIVIAKGTYAFNAEILLDKDVTLRGATGNPEDVVFNAAKTGIRLVRLNAAGAKVEGIAMQGGNLQNNTASYTGYGGGIYIGASGGTVSNCIVRACRTWIWSNEGDGIYIETGADAALVTHTVISNCVSDASNNQCSGNAIAMHGGKVRNCFIAYNKVTRNDATLTGAYGAVYVAGGSLENCTVVKNVSFNCSGVYATGGEVVNCAIGLNTSDFVSGNANYTVWAGDAKFFKKCVAPLYINDDCVIEPETATYASLATENYSLSAASKAVNGGEDRAWMYGVTDFAGATRLQGDHVDIGAYEIDPTNALAASVAADALECFVPHTVNFTVTAVNVNVANVRCTFTFDAGETDVETFDGTTLAKTFETPGDYPVKVRVEDISDPSRFFDVPGYVLIKARTKELYVDAANEHPVAPYASWANAATNVADALAQAIDGNEIVIAKGIHPIAAALQLDRPVTLRGATGNPADVTLKAGTGANRIAVMNHPSARLLSLTVANGKSSDDVGGGVNIAFKGGVVSNCVFHSCQSGCWAKRGGAIAMDSMDGLVTHCVFSNNVCDVNGNGPTYISAGGGIAVYLRNGNVRNSLFVNNGGTSGNNPGGAIFLDGGEVDNCTVVSNRHPYSAGITANGGKVRNCLIVGNTCTTSSQDGHGEVWLGTASCFERCLTDGGEAINGTCFSVPLEGIFKTRGDKPYDLPASSPAVNRGEVLPWMSGATDFYGRPRVVGRIPDIGCVENQSGSGTMLILR